MSAGNVVGASLKRTVAPVGARIIHRNTFTQFRDARRAHLGNPIPQRGATTQAFARDLQPFQANTGRGPEHRGIRARKRF